MFTGIIEAQAVLENSQKEGSSVHFTFASPIAHEFKIDQSVSHNGVCLTVTSISGNHYTVTAIKETLERSNLGELKPGDMVNLERSMLANGRFDGHIVQGHVDTTAKCSDIRDINGSHEFVFHFEKNEKAITVEKGSITVNGVSLTVVQSSAEHFSVCIIPYTLGHTNFKELKQGSRVNIEFDVIGKYVARLLGRG